MKKGKFSKFDYNQTNIETALLEKWDQEHFMHPWAEMLGEPNEFGIITEGDKFVSVGGI